MAVVRFAQCGSPLQLASFRNRLVQSHALDGMLHLTTCRPWNCMAGWLAPRRRRTARLEQQQIPAVPGPRRLRCSRSSTRSMIG